MQLRKLFAIESQAREERLSAEQRCVLRQQLAAPILIALKNRWDAQSSAVLLQIPMGKAIDYALEEWPVLNRDMEDGRLKIDTT